MALQLPSPPPLLPLSPLPPRLPPKESTQKSWAQFVVEDATNDYGNSVCFLKAEFTAAPCAHCHSYSEAKSPKEQLQIAGNSTFELNTRTRSTQCWPQPWDFRASLPGFRQNALASPISLVICRGRCLFTFIIYAIMELFTDPEDAAWVKETLAWYQDLWSVLILYRRGLSVKNAAAAIIVEPNFAPAFTLSPNSSFSCSIRILSTLRLTTSLQWPLAAPVSSPTAFVLIRLTVTFVLSYSESKLCNAKQILNFDLLNTARQWKAVGIAGEPVDGVEQRLNDQVSQPVGKAITLVEYYKFLSEKLAEFRVSGVGCRSGLITRVTVRTSLQRSPPRNICIVIQWFSLASVLQ
ncbi:hypothetical protein B0H16DRAFT_1467116 [Mycena metata]|uniref:Uncharacterized protein n=1 Tax=Mycena metata TaxID=1033252 RepID=A0AAD7MW01_9AGAR|nr:hypothetical protein B0H16DRAFT_1467116 [Mycena metata]